jgi:uncharacterized membrane protein
MPRFCAACGGQMADNATACPACGKAAGQSTGGGAAAAPAAAGGGLADNVAGALAYVTLLPAIIFLLVDPYKTNKFVRFHSFQNIFFAITMAILWVPLIMVMMVPYIGWLISLAVWMGAFVVWIMMVIKAYQGQKFKLPILGDFAEKQAG